jgi:hypothetical protein
MNDHSRLLILGGVVVALAPFVLIGIGIASDYRAAHPNRPYGPHHARNIVLGFAVVTVASVVFGRLSHHTQAPTKSTFATTTTSSVTTTTRTTLPPATTTTTKPPTTTTIAKTTTVPVTTTTATKVPVTTTTRVR